MSDQAAATGGRSHNERYGNCLMTGLTDTNNPMRRGGVMQEPVRSGTTMSIGNGDSGSPIKGGWSGAPASADVSWLGQEERIG